MLDLQETVSPIRLAFLASYCTFCGRPVGEHHVEGLGDHRFIYRNDCPCLDYAQGVMDDDGSYYWEKIESHALPQNERTIANWHSWQDGVDYPSATNNRDRNKPMGETDSQAARDALLYAEAQTILNQYG